MMVQCDLLFDWLKDFRLISYMFVKSKFLILTTLTSAFQPLVCLLVCLAFAAASNTAFGDRPPNIVIILADDLGCCDMAMYNGWIKTPRIEQMAKQGMRFTDFHTNSSVCSPTRAAFLTGRQIPQSFGALLRVAAYPEGSGVRYRVRCAGLDRGPVRSA